MYRINKGTASQSLLGTPISMAYQRYTVRYRYGCRKHITGTIASVYSRYRTYPCHKCVGRNGLAIIFVCLARTIVTIRIQYIVEWEDYVYNPLQIFLFQLIVIRSIVIQYKCTYFTCRDEINSYSMSLVGLCSKTWIG
jgi:hypothetical protein